MRLAAMSSSKRFHEAMVRGISDVRILDVTNLERQSGTVLGPAGLRFLSKVDAHRQLATSLEPGDAPDGVQLSSPRHCSVILLIESYHRSSDYPSGMVRGRAITNATGGRGSGDVPEEIARALLNLLSPLTALCR